jgi:hypothetical protein
MHPLSQSRSVVLDEKQHGGARGSACDVDRCCCVTYAEQLLLASRGVLPLYDPNPRGEIAPPAKHRSVADSRHYGGGDQRSKAGNLA